VSWPKRILLFAALFLACIPLTFLTAMLLTPLLWKLEAPLGIELAGHSGPAEWVFFVLHGVVTALAVLVAWRVFRTRPAAGQRSA